MVLGIGQMLGGRYELSGIIGSGGMADVYKALDHKLNRQVAIKILKREYSADQSFVNKFKMEAQSAASLSDPNVVSIYDVGDEMGIYYIVMELVEGITLKKYIERRGKLKSREALEVAMQVAYALDSAHSVNIVHRDIKPQNILVTKEGKVKVTDFGIARAPSTQTVANNTMGSVYYLSPEQAKGGACDYRSDIYSLGITMYQMVTGRVPYEGENAVSVAMLHIQGQMIPPSTYEPDIPHAFEQIIRKCTQKKPELRYESAKALLNDLKRCVQNPDGDFVVINKENEEHITGRIPSGTSGRTAGMRKTASFAELAEDQKEKKFERLVTYIGIGAGALILIVGLLIVLNLTGVLDFGSGGNQDVVEEGYVKMENVLGKTYEEANALLYDMGLYVKASYVDTDEYPEGQVYRQSISPGNIVEKGTYVSLTIAMSKSNGAEVPGGLEGLDPQEAIEILKKAGFTNISYINEEQYSNTVPEGMVISTNPEPGEFAPKDGLITLIVSRGSSQSTVTVPSLIGLTKEAAAEKLAGFGLKLGTVSEAEDSGEPGKVISQTPSKDTTVVSGASINITISKAKTTQEATVPSLLGKTKEEAEKALTDVGLKLGQVSEESSPNEQKGIVIGQEVAEGVKAKLGTAIDIVIGGGIEEPSTQATEPPTQPTEPPTQQTEEPTETTTEEPAVG